MARRRQAGYKIVPHGGPEHADLLGLVKTGDGFELSDPTPYIVLDPTGRLENIITRQRVAELTSGFPKVQSDDPARPFYAPPLWRPSAIDAAEE